MKRIFVNSLVVLGSTLVALALAEGVLRLIGFSFPGLYTSDPITGSRLRPGAEGWYREEGVAYIKVNSQGLRDREHSLAKPPGTVRVAIIGDSFAEALSVPVEATFWAVLEHDLNACKAFGGKRVEVINFGVSGYGTAQELLTLRHKAWSYAPDVVLLAFFPGNDVRNNSKTLEPGKERPFYVLRDGELRLDDSFRDDPDWQNTARIGARRAPLYQFRLYQLLRRARAGRLEFHHNAPVAMALAHDGAQVPALEQGLDENVFREPPDPVWSDAWAVTDRLVVATQEEARSHGARFLLAVLSSAGSVYPDPEWRRRYMKRLGVADLLYPEHRLQALGAQHGFEVIALAPDMQRYADATHTYLHGFDNTVLGLGHWNAAGHALAGKLIAQRLCGAR
jgi:hypothetical protein